MPTRLTTGEYNAAKMIYQDCKDIHVDLIKPMIDTLYHPSSGLVYIEDVMKLIAKLNKELEPSLSEREFS